MSGLTVTRSSSAVPIRLQASNLVKQLNGLERLIIPAGSASVDESKKLKRSLITIQTNGVDNLQTQQTIASADAFVKRFLGSEKVPQKKQTLTIEEAKSIKQSLVSQHPEFKKDNEVIEELLDLLILVEYGINQRPGDKDLIGCREDILTAVESNNLKLEEIRSCQNVVSDILERKGISPVEQQPAITKKHKAKTKRVKATPAPAPAPAPEAPKPVEAAAKPKAKENYLLQFINMILDFFKKLFS